MNFLGVHILGMRFLSCHSVLFCVDSESDFDLQEVTHGLDGLSDEPTETSSEEPDGGPWVDGDDVESGNNTDGADIHDADAVQETDNDAQRHGDDDAQQTDDKGSGKKRKHGGYKFWQNNTIKPGEGGSLNFFWGGLFGQPVFRALCRIQFSPQKSPKNPPEHPATALPTVGTTGRSSQTCPPPPTCDSALAYQRLQAITNMQHYTYPTSLHTRADLHSEPSTAEKPEVLARPDLRSFTWTPCTTGHSEGQALFVCNVYEAPCAHRLSVLDFRTRFGGDSAVSKTYHTLQHPSTQSSAMHHSSQQPEDPSSILHTPMLGGVFLAGQLLQIPAIPNFVHCNIDDPST